jgi:hypothetical protein
MKHVLRIEVDTSDKDESAAVAVMIKGDVETLGVGIGMSLDKPVLKAIFDHAMMVAIQEKLFNIAEKVDETYKEEKLKEGGKPN